LPRARHEPQAAEQIADYSRAGAGEAGDAATRSTRRSTTHRCVRAGRRRRDRRAARRRDRRDATYADPGPTDADDDAPAEPVADRCRPRVRHGRSNAYSVRAHRRAAELAAELDQRG